MDERTRVDFQISYIKTFVNAKSFELFQKNLKCFFSHRFRRGSSCGSHGSSKRPRDDYLLDVERADHGDLNKTTYKKGYK